MALSLRFAARSDVGLVRDGNEDSGYAGPHLLVIADGMGGHAAGEVASSVAVSALAPLDDDVHGPDLLDRLSAAVRSANAQIADMTSTDPILEGMGTTLTALISTGTRVGLVHVGDSRGYLLRDGELHQITRDHTFVQSLVDEGRLSAEEADHHPHKNVITRALDGRDEVEFDLSVREIQAGDRFLLCSDGLSNVVSADTLVETLGRGTAADTAETLVQLALRAGGPDNITCVVADFVEDDTPATAEPVVVGAAAAERPRASRNGDSAASRAAALTSAGREADLDDDDPVPPAGRRRWLAPAFLFLLLAAVIGVGGYLGWAWAQTQYYVGTHEKKVAIFRGVSQSVAGISLSRVAREDALPLSSLPPFERERVRNTISAEDKTDAEHIVVRLRQQACANAAAKLPAPKPTPSPRPSASARPRASASASPGGATASPSPSPSPVPHVPGVDCSSVEVSTP